MNQSDKNCKPSQSLEVTGDLKGSKIVNKAGAVRPRKYASKLQFKTRRTETHTEPASIASEMDCGIRIESHTEPASIASEIDCGITSCVMNVDEDHHEVFQDASVCSIDNTKITEVKVSVKQEKHNDPDDLMEKNFIDFLKQREEIELDKLLQKNFEMNFDDGNKDEDVEDHEGYENEEKTNDDSCSGLEDAPIYPGHFLTISNSILLIWMFAITHSLTSDQMSDLLSLLSLHMINPYPALKSFYRFKRYFQSLNSPLIKHFYCAFCSESLDENTTTCPNRKCQKTINKSSKEYFLELPIITQLNGLFSREEFTDGLKFRRERVKKNEDNIEDVYDSAQYKLLSEEGGPLHSKNEHNISFTFHTDGVPVFKSSKMSLWPIFLMINELPYNMRKNRENMILCGLWFGQSKPLINLFCKPLHSALIELERGVSVKPENRENNFIVQGYLYCMTCDIPARNSVLNINQHNGAYCCPKCLQQGKNYRTATGGNVRTFPYDVDNPEGPPRDANEMKNNAQDAIISGIPKNGVKGPSFAMFCPAFDPVKNIGIDYMHAIFLGIVRLFLNLWFGVSHSLQNFSIYQYVDIVDNRLSSIKPTHFITRTPRSIRDHLKFWKAAELRSWFFYYSVPCLIDLLQPKHFYHFCAFVEAIYLLDQSSISKSDIEKSERLLKYFVFMMPGLYGERYMTINIHSLLHFPQLVRELGPLWAISCFPFESASGDLLKLFHGTQYIDIQIINAVHVFHTLPSLSQNIPKSSAAYPLIKSMLKSDVRSTGSFQLYGKGYSKIIDQPTTALICRNFMKNVTSQDLLFYKRAVIRGVMYHSSDYTRVHCRNSYTVKFINDKNVFQFGMIQWFAKLIDERQDDDCSCSFAFVSVFNFVNANIFSQNEEHAPDHYIESNFMEITLPHMHFIEHTNEHCIVKLQNIVDLCLYVKTDNHTTVCEEPNHNEINL